MGDADRGVVAREQVAQGLVDQGLGFGVEGAGGFVEDEDVGVLEEGARDGDALFLAARELGAAGAGVGLESVGLWSLSVRLFFGRVE